MTAAESKAAYEQRCRRREKQATRASTTAAGAADSRGGAMIVDDMISAVLSNARSRSDDVAATSTQPANGSSLDPAVQPFQPRPSSGVGSATSSSAWLTDDVIAANDSCCNAVPGINTIKCILFNSQSLCNKLIEFNIFCKTSDFDVVCVTESWLKSRLPDSCIADTSIYSVCCVA